MDGFTATSPVFPLLLWRIKIHLPTRCRQAHELPRSTDQLSNLLNHVCCCFCACRRESNYQAWRELNRKGAKTFNSIFLCKHKHPQKLWLSYRNTVSLLSRQVLCQQVKALSPDSLWAGMVIHQPGPHTDNSWVTARWEEQLRGSWKGESCWLPRRLWVGGMLTAGLNFHMPPFWIKVYLQACESTDFQHELGLWCFWNPHP